MPGVRNEPDAPRPAAEAADGKIPLPYQAPSPARPRRSTYELFAGVAALMVLAVSAAGLVMVQLAALGGSLRGYRALYLIATGFTGEPSALVKGCGDASRKNS